MIFTLRRIFLFVEILFIYLTSVVGVSLYLNDWAIFSVDTLFLIVTGLVFSFFLTFVNHEVKKAYKVRNFIVFIVVILSIVTMQLTYNEKVRLEKNALLDSKFSQSSQVRHASDNAPVYHDDKITH